MTALPDVTGFRFRMWEGDGDFEVLSSVHNAARAADGLKILSTPAEFANVYRNRPDTVLERDLLIVEDDDGPVAFTSVNTWVEESDGSRVLSVIARALPGARVDPGFAPMILWGESRLREISVERPHAGAQRFQAYVDEGESELGVVLADLGYEVTHYWADMTRPMSLPTPDRPLPGGVDVRPVTWDDARAVWEADQLAFADHHGYTAPTEEDFQSLLDDPNQDPELWKVAFSGDDIVGQVLNFVNHPENEEYGRLRGYTEDIAVVPGWRKRGIASSLICESIEMFRELGMEEVALGVHTTNPTGALSLYETLGYELTALHRELHKGFEPT